jgi:rsbT co-antagonist protein RsbR
MTPEPGVPFEQVFDLMPVSAAIWRLVDLSDPASLAFVTTNQVSARQLQAVGLPRPGQRMIDVYPNIPMQMLETYAHAIRTGQPLNLGEVAFDDERGGTVVYQIQLIPLHDNQLCIVHEDVTARKHAEEALRQSLHLEETIRAQNAALAELSTPLIPISDDVTVMPLIGAVDSRRAQQVMETLLEGIAQTRARVAILDITGVPVVDTQVANALIRAAQSVKLLGAQVILTGIRPEVAQTLVGLGADLSAITTRSSLQSGIAYATNKQERARAVESRAPGSGAPPVPGPLMFPAIGGART